MYETPFKFVYFCIDFLGYFSHPVCVFFLFFHY